MTISTRTTASLVTALAAATVGIGVASAAQAAADADTGTPTATVTDGGGSTTPPGLARFGPSPNPILAFDGFIARIRPGRQKPGRGLLEPIQAFDRFSDRFGLQPPTGGGG
ncbi:MAG: hypothetical protein QOD59_4196 [Mycobacterium sp.]|jgi:hypothetical protein|nr:hypothetical protein [Mycobacterium sp.]MDT7794755.1 hypothetical protein [Mycobacterium sp.]